MVGDDLATANAPEAGGRWTFDEDVTASFDDMLARSIPNYGDMRRFVTEAAAYAVNVSATSQTYPTVVDIGASRGSGLAPIIDRLGARARYLATDLAAPMVETLRERFRGYIEANVLEVRQHDLRTGFPIPAAPAAVVLSVLTLQFIPIEYRAALLRSAHEQMTPGALLILVEKVLGGNAETDRLLTRLYRDLKMENGYSQGAVERKALSLEGVLVPLTARFDEELVRDAGFNRPECVWAWGPFRGWVAVRR